MAISEPSIRAELSAQFENLTDDVEKTSEMDPAYNCMAWAAGDTSSWWECTPCMMGVGGYYWPPELRAWDGDTFDGWLRLFRHLGFETCDSADLETEYEKVAIYVQPDLKPTHVARQLQTGAWTSKLGEYVDVEHPNLEVLAGAVYGQIGAVLRRHRV